MGDGHLARRLAGLAALTVALAGCGTTAGSPTIAASAATGHGPVLGTATQSAVRPVDPTTGSPQPSAVTVTVTPSVTLTPGAAQTPNMSSSPAAPTPPVTSKPPLLTKPSTSKPPATVAVTDATIAPFVGSGLSDSVRVIISQLGVVFVNTTSGVTVMQAKTIAGDVISAKVTYSEGGFAVGGMQAITVSGLNLKIAGASGLSVEYARHPFRSSDIKSFVGDWAGHSRSATVAADGKVQISMRDYSKDFSAPPLKIEGVLVPNGSGWQLRVYLSDSPDLPVGSPFTVTFSQDVLSFGDLPFCGDNAKPGACGA